MLNDVRLVILFVVVVIYNFNLGIDDDIYFK